MARKIYWLSAFVFVLGVTPITEAFAERPVLSFVEVQADAGSDLRRFTLIESEGGGADL